MLLHLLGYSLPPTRVVGWASEAVRNTYEGGREYLYRWSDTPVGVVATTSIGGRMGLGGGTEYL